MACYCLLLFGLSFRPFLVLFGVQFRFTACHSQLLSILSGLGYFGCPLLAGSDFDLLGFRASQGLPLITLLGFKGFPLPTFVGLGWRFGGRVSSFTVWYYGLRSSLLFWGLGSAIAWLVVVIGVC